MSGAGTTAVASGSLPPVAENVFAPAPEGYELVGAHCEACGKHYFPMREHCPACLGGTVRAGLGSGGVIYSYTIVRTRPPFGLPQPYGVAYIDLDEHPLRVFGLLDPGELEEVHIGAPVSLSVGPMGVNNDGRACLRPYFQLSPGPGGN